MNTRGDSHPMSIGETAANEDSGEENISEVLANVTRQDTRDGFIAGPWELVEASDEGNAIISPPVDSLRAGDTWWTAVIICGDRATQNAVARRMHAANDLLAALKECAADFRSPPCTISEGYALAAHEFMRRQKIARAAIAKAEGETP